MPAVDPVRNTNVVRKRKIKVKRKPRSAAPPISGDQRDRMRAARAQQLRESVPKTPDQADRKRSPQQQAHDHAVVNRIVRETRERAVAKRNRGSGTRAVKRELEGHGVVAKTVGKLAGHVEHTTRGPVPRLRAQAFPGVSPTLAGRAVKDAVNLPAQAVPSLYVPAAGLVEAAQGRPQRFKRLAHDVSRNDPVYNLGAAAVEKARGHDRAARVHLDRAKRAASEHPGFTAAELYGVHGAAGRTAGATVRTAAKATGSKTLKRAGSTERAPRTLPGTNVQENRQYSRDLFRKTRQVVEDRNKRKVAGELRAQAKAEKDPDRRAELERQARAKDPTVLRDRDIARRVDEHVDAVEQVRRHHRTQVTAAVRKTVRKEAGPLPSLLAQRIVRADVGDVKAYIGELQAEHARMASPSKRRANEQLRHKLGKAVAGVESGRVNLPRAKAAADEYAAESRRGQAGPREARDAGRWAG
jgi:hypothetical protein